MLDQVSAATPPETFLALDFGLKRTGFAYGTRLLQRAQGLNTLVAHGKQKRLSGVAFLIQQWQPDALVLGIPTYPDGQAHEMTTHAKNFAKQLRGRFKLPVFEVDERYSSVEAQAQGANDLDMGAAVIILEQFLRSL